MPTGWRKRQRVPNDGQKSKSVKEEDEGEKLKAIQLGRNNQKDCFNLDRCLLKINKN